MQCQSDYAVRCLKSPNKTYNRPPAFPPIHTESPCSSALKALAVLFVGRMLQNEEASPVSSSYRNALISPVRRAATSTG
jgi:hypothetical protein